MFLLKKMKNKIKSQGIRADRRCTRSESEGRMQPDTRTDEH